MSSLSVKGNKAQKFSYQICIWHWFDRLATHSVSSGRDTLPQKCGWDAKQSGNNIQLLFTNDVNFEGVVAQPKIQNNIWNSKQYMKFKTTYEIQNNIRKSKEKYHHDIQNNFDIILLFYQIEP